MNYCTKCGTKLEMRFLESEGKEIPYCPSCEEFRFPMYNVAVSMVVMNRSKDKIVLIKQYGKDRYVLVAGYVNLGEDAEDAVVREVKEEMGLDVVDVQFNHSRYFAPSNTLMLNFTAIVEDENVHANEEIDSYKWFSFEEAREAIYQGSLAHQFLLGCLDGKYKFQ